MKKESINMDKAEDETKEIPDHEVESAAHDMMRAEAHKANPHMMKKIHAHLEKKKKAITSIQDLKDLRNESYKNKE